MFQIKFLTFMLASSISSVSSLIPGLRYIESEPVREVEKMSVNSKGCGMRKGGQLPYFDQLKESSQVLDNDLEADDGMMYDDTGMESRVVGGIQSTEKWPWMAGIFYQGFYECGGSIIDDRNVLTAAHCFDEDDDPREYSVRIGELIQGDSGRSYEIEWLKIHNDYTAAPSYFNDIALLRLRDPVPKTTVPICLPSNDALVKGDTLTIIGFGAKRQGDVASETLQEVHNLPLISTSTCDKIIRSLSPTLKGVTDAQLCTGDMKGGRGSCQGDSGGPVIMEENGRWWLLGLVSYSSGCARPGMPTVHTRVSIYRRWIDKSIAEGEEITRKKGFKNMIVNIFGRK